MRRRTCLFLGGNVFQPTLGQVEVTQAIASVYVFLMWSDLHFPPGILGHWFSPVSELLNWHGQRGAAATAPGPADGCARSAGGAATGGSRRESRGGSGGQRPKVGAGHARPWSLV